MPSLLDDEPGTPESGTARNAKVEQLHGVEAAEIDKIRLNKVVTKKDLDSEAV